MIDLSGATVEQLGLCDVVPKPFDFLMPVAVKMSCLVS